MADPGYGWTHQQLRRQLLPYAYGRPCHFCGHPLLPGQPLDLDHTPDRQSYRGLAHAECNRRHGAEITNTKRRNKQAARSRDW